MPYTVTTPPASEPISLAEAKLQCRVLDGVLDDDALITIYIQAARQEAEQKTGRALITQTITEYFPAWQTRYQLSVGPVQSVSSVSYIADGGSSYTSLTADTHYFTDIISLPAEIHHAQAFTYPTLSERPNPVRIIYVAGNTQASDVPPTIRQAMLLLIAAYYEHREDAEIIWQTSDPRVQASDALLRNNRTVYL
jgi:uncharacterized phiE125 gp8 family phage protein